MADRMSEPMRDRRDEGRQDRFVDVDRMVNEGLGGGRVTIDNGLIEDSTVHTMDEPESVLQSSGAPVSSSGISVQRAKEIMQADRHIAVFYGSDPVYLEQVDERDGTVTVRNLTRPGEKQTVRVEALVEGEDTTLC